MGKRLLVLPNVEQEWRVELAIKGNARQSGICMLEHKNQRQASTRDHDFTAHHYMYSEVEQITACAGVV